MPTTQKVLRLEMSEDEARVFVTLAALGMDYYLLAQGSNKVVDTASRLMYIAAIDPSVHIAVSHRLLALTAQLED